METLNSILILQHIKLSQKETIRLTHFENSHFEPLLTINLLTAKAIGFVAFLVGGCGLFYKTDLWR